MNGQALLIEKITSHIRENDEIPLFGNAAPLNLEDLSALLASQLGIEDLTVRVKNGQWKEKEIKTKGTVIPITLSPIEEPIYWMMTKADKEKLTSFLFSNNKKKTPISQALQDGFYRYLLLEALSAASTLEPIQQMSMTLEEEGKTPEGEAYTLDVEISSVDLTVWGKCIITKTFRKNWIQHFSAFPPRYIPNKLSLGLPVEIGVKIGSVQIAREDWNNLQIGDFLIPDILANDQRGTLMLDQVSLFQVHVHENKIEALDYALENSTEEPSEIESQSLPLQISIEIGRLKIPVDQLMNLSPGNFLAPPLFSDKRVSLITNGQMIGFAELVQLGETPGLRVLEKLTP